jgi:hypothetical protein
MASRLSLNLGSKLGKTIAHSFFNRFAQKKVRCDHKFFSYNATGLEPVKITGIPLPILSAGHAEDASTKRRMLEMPRMGVYSR